MNLENLPNREALFAALPKGGILAEIGTLDGGWAAEILKYAEPRLLFLIDCWQEQSVEAVGHDPANENHREHYHKTIRRFLMESRVKIIKEFSVHAAPLFPDNFFDALYIDANHLECYADMQTWWPKVKSGGWFLGHDYVRGGLDDYITVQADVDRWMAERPGLKLFLTTDPVYQNWVVCKP